MRRRRRADRSVAIRASQIQAGLLPGGYRLALPVGRNDGGAFEDAYIHGAVRGRFQAGVAHKQDLSAVHVEPDPRPIGHGYGQAVKRDLVAIDLPERAGEIKGLQVPDGLSMVVFPKTTMVMASPGRERGRLAVTLKTAIPQSFPSRLSGEAARLLRSATPTRIPRLVNGSGSPCFNSALSVLFP